MFWHTCRSTEGSSATQASAFLTLPSKNSWPPTAPPTQPAGFALDRSYQHTLAQPESPPLHPCLHMAPPGSLSPSPPSRSRDRTLRSLPPSASWRSAGRFGHPTPRHGHWARAARPTPMLQSKADGSAASAGQRDFNRAARSAAPTSKRGRVRPGARAGRQGNESNNAQSKSFPVFPQGHQKERPQAGFGLLLQCPLPIFQNDRYYSLSSIDLRSKKP